MALPISALGTTPSSQIISFITETLIFITRYTYMCMYCISVLGVISVFLGEFFSDGQERPILVLFSATLSRDLAINQLVNPFPKFLFFLLSLGPQNYVWLLGILSKE